MLANGYSAKSFCTAKLSDVEFDKLVVLVEPMFTWFAPGSTPEVIKSRLCQHPNAIVKVVFFKETPCAFGVHYCQDYRGTKVLYRGGTVVAEQHRSHGLYSYLVGSSFLDEKPAVVVTRTQNPRVYESLLPHVTSLYPSIDGKPIPVEVYEIAVEFSHSGEIETNLRVRDVYADLRKEKSFRFAKNVELNKFFDENLGEIDAFMVVGLI